MSGPYKIGDDMGAFMLVSEVKVDIANAAYADGASAMREAAAQVVWNWLFKNGNTEEIARAIRALPLHPTPEGQ